jgi:iron complex transport system ATP-binding protein
VIPGPGGITCTDLSCGYPRSGRTVLDGVNLAAPRGRFVCVIGPNGSGKTTLLRTMAGLIPALKGTVTLGDRDVRDITATERARQLSVVLTSYDSPGYLAVRSFVELGRHPYTGLLGRRSDADDEAVDLALEQTGIDHLAGRWMAEISDGERQRAAVARALAQAADVMILDEPTAFLDVAARASVMTTLRTIAHQTGRLIISSSHDVEMVLRMADLVVMIHQDGTLQHACPEDLVLSGALDRLFPGDSLRFDPVSGTYRLPHPEGPAVAIQGRGVVAEWIAHAMERIGHRVDESGSTRIVVDGSSYRLHDDSSDDTFETIGELVEAVRSAGDNDVKLADREFSCGFGKCLCVGAHFSSVSEKRGVGGQAFLSPALRTASTSSPIVPKVLSEPLSWRR